MHSADVILEMEYLNVVALLYLLFRGHTFGIDLCIFVQVHDGMLSRRLSVEPVGAGLVNSDATTFCLVRDLGLLDQLLDQVVNCPCLGYKKVVLILSSVSWRLIRTSRTLTSFVIPSVSHVNLTLFLVSSSVKLISSTSK